MSNIENRFTISGSIGDSKDIINAKLSGAGTLSGKVDALKTMNIKDYEFLENKPQINSVELIGNKSSEDLGLDPEYASYAEVFNMCDSYFSKSEV